MLKFCFVLTHATYRNGTAWEVCNYTSPSLHMLNIPTAVKAITAAQLSLASQGVYSVTLDEAIEAMRLTASDMSVKYKETSLSVSGSSIF